jgi:DNA-binding Lrp family transcriptional regulator
MNSKRASGVKNYLEACAEKGKIPPQKEIVTRLDCSPQSLPKRMRELEDRYIVTPEHKWQGPRWEYGGAYIVTKRPTPEPPPPAANDQFVLVEPSEPVASQNGTDKVLLGVLERMDKRLERIEEIMGPMFGTMKKLADA